MKKYIYILIILSISLIFKGSIAQAIIPSNLKLKTSSDKILNYKKVEDVRCDQQNNNCQKFGQMIKYIYASEKIVPIKTENNLTENIDLRTKNSYTFILKKEKNKETRKTIFLAGQPFVKKISNNQWYQTEIATTTIDAFDKQNNPVSLRLIKYVYADSDTYYPDPDPESTTFDGTTYKDNSTVWSTVRNAASSIYSNDTAVTNNILDQLGNGNGANYYGIRRSHLLFNTSNLPDDATLNSATLSLWGISATTISGSEVIYIVAATTVSNTQINLADYGTTGTTSFGTTGATLNIGSYNDVSLNANGLNNISKTGISKFASRTYNDFNNIAPDNNTEVSMNTSSADETGTTQDPKLTVTYNVISRPVIQSGKINVKSGKLIIQ